MMIAMARARPAIDRGAGWAIGILEALCVAALAFTGGLLVWTVVAPGSAARMDGRLPAAAAAAPSRPVFDRSILWRADLFGRPDAAAVGTAPETSLNLTLFGVAAGIGETPGSAVIRTPDNRQNVFREGATIIDGVTLERVLPDRVVIRREGAAETLFFPNAQRPVPAAPDAPADSVRVLDPDALYGAMEFEGVVRDGRVAGLRIVRALDAALLAQAGVAEGDIVIEIAGRAVADIVNVADQFERLRGAESIDFVVERNGAQIPLTIAFGTPQ